MNQLRARRSFFTADHYGLIGKIGGYLKLHDPFPKRLHLLHIVRRYGPVGGMERYVWELTAQQHMLGHRVTVVCESCHGAIPLGIEVHALGQIAARPRWLAALRFGWRAQKWLAAIPHHDAIIHSHERIGFHDITTFHGALFAPVLERPWWRLISLRVAMNLYLERRELAVAKCIVPNSELMKRQLAQYYPMFAHKLSAPVTPGIKSDSGRAPRNVAANGGVIGFVGKEWKRKGLPLAVSIVAHLRRTRPDLQFIVMGPNPHDVQHLFGDWNGTGYLLKEWDNHVEFSDFDILLHPARSEPYGMVISEAMAAQVPVVISSACGASMDVAPASGAVLSLDASVNEWAQAVDSQLRRTELPPRFERTWRSVAHEYEGILYSMKEGGPSPEHADSQLGNGYEIK